MTPTYELVPGRSVGIFELGDSLWHILDLIRTQKVLYPKVDIAWDPDCPHTSAVTIHLPSLALYFPPASPSQTLQLILLPSLPTSSLVLTYQSHVFASPSQPLTRGKVGRALGPTYAGERLQYPGVEFELRKAGDGGGVVGGGGGGAGREDVVEKVRVVPKEGEEGRVKSPVKGCVVLPGKGITLDLGTSSVDILLHETTAQDLLLDLGPPLRKFYKEDDRMSRMWGAASQTAEEEGASCFWNYFQYGLDFLISPEGIVTKIIAHSNIPGTPLFQRYARLPWLIHPPSDPSLALSFTSPLSAFQSALAPSSSPPTPSTSKSPAYTDEITLAVPALHNGGGSKKKKRSASNSSSGAVSAEDGPKTGKSGGTTEVRDAMLLDRAGEGGLEGVVGVGESRLVGFEGLIVEEDLASGGICSVLVWKEGSAVSDGA